MKTKCIFALILAVLLLVSGCAGETVKEEKGNALFGSFSAADMEGNPVNQEVFKDHKLTMINIWATFCGPCIQEMPELAQLQEEYGEDFQIIGIVVDAADRNGNILPDKKAEAASIIEATGADYLHLLPSTSLTTAYLGRVQAVPETVFVDENGNQVGQSYVGARNKEQWKVIIDSLM